MANKNAKFQLTSVCITGYNYYLCLRYYSHGLDAVPVFSRTLNLMLTDLSIVPLVIIAHTLPGEPSSTVTTLGSNATVTPVNVHM